ncbi:MAG: D-Ala-D-Ala carboxypeptidase family metallohydrolase [Roseibacillus sp.]|nr:D-Ala-D-Ala carboxypeptidase family metallohydrolase [Roseibacillus sp.]
MPSTSRRSFLSASLLTASGMFAAISPSQAVSLFSGSANLDIDELPNEWVRRQGADLHAYARYLSALRLRHITVQQVIVSHAKRKGSIWNNLPTRENWRLMSETLRVADEISVRLGTSVKSVTSAFRSPSYNARCPGAKPNSLHKDNVALDLKFHASTWAVARAARNIREEGKFRGGVGRYSGFTHVDTRGYNVDW